MIGRRQHQFDFKVILQTRRRQQLVAGGAGLAGNRHKRRFALGVAGDNIDGLVARTQWVIGEPAQQAGTLRRPHDENAAILVDPDPSLDLDFNVVTIGAGADQQPADRTIAVQAAIVLIFLLQEIALLVDEFVHAQHQAKLVVDALQAVAAALVKRNATARYSIHADLSLYVPSCTELRPITKRSSMSRG